MKTNRSHDKTTQLRSAADQDRASRPRERMSDLRPEASIQRKLRDQTRTPVQRKANETGLPDKLKTGMENLSGMAMDDVRVHRNSTKPAQLNAHAYAKGTDIHLAPGQDKHLPHEAWHVVQQKQGRVQPTGQLKGKVAINDDAGLEREADVMGARALQMMPQGRSLQTVSLASGTAQLVKDLGVRERTDRGMDELRHRVGEVIGALKEKGEAWGRQYGDKAKQTASSKAESLLKGEDLIDKEAIKRQAIKKLWEQVSTEDKIAMIKLGGRIIGSAASGVLESLTGGSTSSSGDRGESSSRRGGSRPGLLSSLLSSGGRGESSSREEPRSDSTDREGQSSGLLGSLFGSSGSDRDRSSSSSDSSWISSLDEDQVRAIYEVYKQKREFDKHLEEAKQKIISTAGDVGERIGREVGETREEYDFNRQVSSQHENFMALREAYTRLEAEITDNDDKGRYQSELDALHDALFNINGPAMAFRRGLSTRARTAYPEVCELVLSNLSSSGGFFRKAARLKAAVVSGVSTVKETLGVEDTELPDLQGRVVTKLYSVLDSNWSSVTKVWSTPKGVGRIKKALDRSQSAEEVLTAAALAATPEAARSSPRRDPATRQFYQALSNLRTDSIRSLTTTLDELQEVADNL